MLCQMTLEAVPPYKRGQSRDDGLSPSSAERSLGGGPCHRAKQQ